MKLNRVVTMAAAGLLAVGAIGAAASQALAQAPKAPAAQVAVTATSVPPVDIQVDQQSGDQVGDQAGPEATDVPGAVEPTEAAGAADSGPNDQNPVLNGSVPVTDTLAEGTTDA